MLFAKEGAQVAIIEIDEAKGAATEKSVREQGGDALFIPTDITREDNVKRAVLQAVMRFGKLDILYNCAGGSIVNDGLVNRDRSG